MSNKSAIVLDIDGTLADSVTQHQAAFATAMRTFPFKNLDTNWNGYRHHTDTGIFAEAWEREGQDGVPPFDGLEGHYRQAYDASGHNKPGCRNQRCPQVPERSLGPMDCCICHRCKRSVDG